MPHLITNPDDKPSWEHIEDISLHHLSNDPSLSPRGQVQRIFNELETSIVEHSDETEFSTKPPSNLRRRLRYQNAPRPEGLISQDITPHLPPSIELPALPRRQFRVRNRSRPERPTEYITGIFLEHSSTFIPLPNANDYFVRYHSDSTSPTPPPDPFLIDKEGSVITDGSDDSEKGKWVEKKDEEKEVGGWKRDSKMDGVEEEQEVEALGGSYSKVGSPDRDEEDQDWVWMAKHD